MKPLDYALYNRVKEKFLPEPSTIIFVSLAAENLEKLEGIAHKSDDLVELRTLIDQHAKEGIPYAAIGGFAEDDVGYNFSCSEFEQEEDLISKKIVAFSIGTYPKKPVNIEAVKKDLLRLKSGVLLSGNA